MPETNDIFLSGDGSHTLHSSKFDTLLHSSHGAITETSVVFINAGLKYQIDKGLDNISIFEVGFGTGLNVFMSYIENLLYDKKIIFYTIEPFPIHAKTVASLNFPELLGHADVFSKIHSVAWDTIQPISNHFGLCKYRADILSFETSDQFDVIYFDAFSPIIQPEIWDIEILKKMYKILNHGGVLVSYCAQGQFKRNLKLCGFTVENLPGPPGKREMTRAIK